MKVNIIELKYSNFSEDKVKLTHEIRNMEKRHQQEREALSNQIATFSNLSQSRSEVS